MVQQVAPYDKGAIMRCLALDIGGTKIAAAIVKDSEIEQRQQIRTPQDDAATAMDHALEALLTEYAGQFDYVAVASTGIINHGILTALNPKNLGGLAEFPLKASIAKHTDKPIGLLNDVQAAAYAEYQLQDAAQVPNFAFITVSTGVGGGIVLNQQLQTGQTVLQVILDIPWQIRMVLFVAVAVVAAWKRLLRGEPLKRFLPNGMILAILKACLNDSEKMTKKRPHLWIVPPKPLPI